MKSKTLHLLNGEEMNRYFKTNGFLEHEISAPFNEAMCYGDTCRGLFSREFIELRAKVHHVTTAEYEAITMQPLQPLFRSRFERVVLWFDDDMFCQINVLTLLAWLDGTEFRGKIELRLVDDSFREVARYMLMAHGYEAVYDKVLIDHRDPAEVEPAVLKRGIERYLQYRQKDSDLMLYIRNHRQVPEKALIRALLGKFKEYGLGDNQYAEIIRFDRGNSN